MDPDNNLQDSDGSVSLVVVLPLAVTGLVIATGCWTLFAVGGPVLQQSLSFNNLQFGLLLAMPMAVAAALALPAGLAASQFGARRVMVGCLIGLALCMLLLLLVESFAGYLLVAAGMGLSGGFYSAGLQFVAGHAPRRHMGISLGIFGAGLAGAGFSYYLLPLLLHAYSWQQVPLAYLVVLVVLALLLVLLTEDVPAGRESFTSLSPGQLVSHLACRDTLPVLICFGLLAGGFFALALWLPGHITSQFVLTLEGGGKVALWFVIPAAFAQIAGGGLTDCAGSQRVLIGSLLLGLLALLVLSYPPMTLLVEGIHGLIRVDYRLPLPVERWLILLLGLAMGSGMGALQARMVLLYPGAPAFAAGALLLSACACAFLLLVLFGAAMQWVGVRSTAFMVLFGLLFVSSLVALNVPRTAGADSGATDG
ncbi:MFS transporter [Marinobacter sp.]|uniref:MFS transporter n=1 Tax=Marinobacter sp. TaxID=50741 RepID=UPI001986ADDE|nr:MFS transporter [Marinobacter sp.]MBC7193405.1 MFS transporter [Marinobacter sp.]